MATRASQVCYSADPGPKFFPISKIPEESRGWTVSHWKTKTFLVAYNVGDKVTFDVDVTHGEIVSSFQFPHWGEKQA